MHIMKVFPHDRSMPPCKIRSALKRSTGRVMEILSEHTVEGWLEGYLLSGRHALLAVTSLSFTLLTPWSTSTQSGSRSVLKFHGDRRLLRSTSPIRLLIDPERHSRSSFDIYCAKAKFIGSNLQTCARCLSTCDRRRIAQEPSPSIPPIQTPHPHPNFSSTP